MFDQSVQNCMFNAAFDVQLTAQAQRAPHVLMRPRIFPDGNQWCALYGNDLQEGVAGFGATPEVAAADFDNNWHKQTLRQSQEKQG